MTEKPTISILCITYNHVSFITKAIESILCQEVELDFEILVRDDASTDGTRELLKEISANHPGRISLVLEETNTWPSCPLTPLLKLAKGDFIALLEGDDYWIGSKKLGTCVSKMMDDSSLFLIGHKSLEIDQDGNSLAGKDGVVLTQGLPGRYPRGSIPIAHTGSLVFRREIVPLFLDWTQHTTHGDIALKVAAAESGDSQVLEEVWSSRRFHSGGIWSAASDDSRTSRSLITLNYLVKEVVNCREELEVMLAQTARAAISSTVKKGHLVHGISIWLKNLIILRHWRAIRFLLLPKQLVLRN